MVHMILSHFKDVLLISYPKPSIATLLDLINNLPCSHVQDKLGKE